MDECQKFVWVRIEWTMELMLTEWHGYSLYETLNEPESEVPGTVTVSIREDEELDLESPSLRHYEWLAWILKHQREIQDAFLIALFLQYPQIEAAALEWFDASEVAVMNTLLPELKKAEDLKRIVSPSGLYLASETEHLKDPLYAVQFECAWDDQGINVLMYGLKVLEISAENRAIQNDWLKELIQELLRAEEHD